MNWNIEQLSWDKIRITGLADAIARTVVSEDIDILLVLEVRSTRVLNIMANLSMALNARAVAAGGGANDYKGWFLSNKTGAEYYGFVVKDLDAIRPVQLAAANAGPNGTEGEPVNDMNRNTWSVWFNNFTSNVDYNNFPKRVFLPILDVYASSPSTRSKRTFSGQSIARGGYSLGRGFRLPGLAMFMVHTINSNTLIPIVCCHYAAVRSGNNHLGQGQVSQLKLLHIAQLFRGKQSGNVNDPIESSYINLAGAPLRVEEILFTGDYNLDFLENSTGGTAIAKNNRRAYSTLTPTVEQGGSAAPAALPGTAQAFAATQFTTFPPGPFANVIIPQDLKAAVTTEGTILKRFDPNVNPPDTAALKGAAFDNFIYGGTRLSTAPISMVTQDAGEVIDVPARIVQKGNVNNVQDLDLSGVAAHFERAGTRDADQAMDLQGQHNVAQALDVNDRLIGARLVSDHLPVVIEFDVP